MAPLVSICLPILNGQPFLEERLESIISQTYKNWELIVVDSYSEDGSWDLLRRYASRDLRIRLEQAPRGLYECWNRCLRSTSGKYVYIATSDDTMMPACIETMVNALEAWPSCGLCHCCLQIIDEESRPIPGTWEQFDPFRYYGDWMQTAHIRRAPLDGILHLGLGTIYTSVTQLLIRQSLFGQIGYFDPVWGPPADFEWALRASMVTDTVHVPEYLATWRIHQKQVTSLAEQPERLEQMTRMAEAYQEWLQDQDLELSQLVRKSLRMGIHPKRAFQLRYRQASGWRPRMAALALLGLHRPDWLWQAGVSSIARKAGRKDAHFADTVEMTRQLIVQLGLDDHVEKISLSAPSPGYPSGNGSPPETGRAS